MISRVALHPAGHRRTAPML